MIGIRQAVIAAIVALVIIFAGYALWQHSRSKAAQARLESAKGEAVVDSAKDAIGAQAQAQRDREASDELTRQNERDIRNAKGADVQVDSDVDLAGRRSLCKRPAYSGRPECAMFRSGQGLGETR